MREFLSKNWNPEIGSLFSLAFFFRMWYSHFIEHMFYPILWLEDDHIQMKSSKYVTDGKTYDSTQTLQNTMSPARQAVWTAVVTASAWQLVFPVGSVILFPQMDGVFPFSRFYLQTNVFLTALTARIIVTPMSGGLPLPRRKSANWRWNFTGGIILKVFF